MLVDKIAGNTTQLEPIHLIRPSQHYQDYNLHHQLSLERLQNIRLYTNVELKIDQSSFKLEAVKVKLVCPQSLFTNEFI